MSGSVFTARLWSTLEYLSERNPKVVGKILRSHTFYLCLLPPTVLLQTSETSDPFSCTYLSSPALIRYRASLSFLHTINWV